MRKKLEPKHLASFKGNHTEPSRTMDHSFIVDPKQQIFAELR
jgi:hypothetical protein